MKPRLHWRHAPLVAVGLLAVACGRSSDDVTVPGTYARAQAAASVPGRVVTACVDEVPWLPFAFAGEEGGEFTGATTELVREVLRRQRLELVVRRLPWKRCMSALLRGEALITYDAILGEERRDRFLFSAPLYRMQEVFYFAPSRFPQGAPARTVDDVARLRVCGVLGYSYSALPFDASRIDAHARSPSILLEKLRVGRCDLALGYDLPFRESAKRGTLNLDGLSQAPIPGASDIVLGVMAARSIRGAEAMIALVNEGLAALRADGTYMAIMDRFGVKSNAIEVPDKAGGLE